MLTSEADPLTMLRCRTRALASVFCAGLGSCSLAPRYQIPTVPAPPPDYHGVAEWKIAAPADALERGRWWQMYRDPGLDTLEARVDEANQELKGAFARLQQARAQTRIARAAYFPGVS